MSPSTLVLGGTVKTLGCDEPPPELGTWGGGQWVVHPADVQEQSIPAPSSEVDMERGAGHECQALVVR
jgi:hypothetical protein